MSSVLRNLAPVADPPADQNPIPPTLTETDEHAVIGAAILANPDIRTVMLGSYRPSDLTDPRCVFVDDLLRRMQNANVPVDQLTVVQFAQRHGLATGPSATTLASWVSQVVNAAPVPMSGTFYAAAVVEDSCRRAVRAAGEEYVRVADQASITELEQVVQKQTKAALAAIARAKVAAA